MDKEKHYLESCRQRIEEKVGWGPGNEWQNQDFEALSKRILKETKVSLSVSTLKRVWGKVRYEGSPTTATLNALAQFVGYEDWRTFTSNGKLMSSNGASAKGPSKISFSKMLKATLAIAALGLGMFLFSVMQSRPKRLEYENITFNSQATAKTVPNTVVFNYNAKDSNADSVFIQQSWDPNRRFRVDKNLTEYTSTYYLPGYYRAKLILDTTVVAEHDIFIESNGWLATVDRGPIPVYADEQKILHEGIVSVSDDFVTDQKIDLEKEKLWTSYFRVVKNEVIPDDAFQMDVTLKNTFGKGALVCQHTHIVLLGTMGAIAIPLTIKGCVGEIGLQADKYFDGKTNDLSAFGVDFSDWATVQCVVENKRIFIRVNDALSFEGDYQNGIGGIVGARIMFLGNGAVKEFALRRIPFDPRTP
jgi:hypothetical protein